METTRFGATGVTVSRFCLGAMMFGPMGTTDDDECIAMVHRALDAGINLVDTADAYSAGRSEELVGQALAGRRDGVVVATKVYFPMGDDPNARGGSRRWIRQAVEGSLRRLGTDRIDVYQLHRRDPATDLAESLEALDQLVREGKILYAGMSATPAEWIVEGRRISDERRLVRVRSEQSIYNILNRGIEAGVLPTCARHGIGVLTYGPLNGGWLTGKYRRGAEPPADSRAARMGRWQGRRWDLEREANRRKLEVIDRLAELAGDAGLPLSHLATAFAAEHPTVSSVIIGPRTPFQLEDALAAAEVRLSADVLDRIDELVAPGTDLDPLDTARVEPHMEPAARRRSR